PDHAPSTPYPLSLHDALPISLGDLHRRLGSERLHVDHAGAEFLVGRELLPEPEVVRAAVGILEHDLRNREVAQRGIDVAEVAHRDRKSTRLNSSHLGISYAVF